MKSSPIIEASYWEGFDESGGKANTLMLILDCGHEIAIHGADNATKEQYQIGTEWPEPCKFCQKDKEGGAA